MGAIFSVGYQGTTVESLFDCLKKNKVAVLVDVRSSPWSKVSGFSRRDFSESAPFHGIRYSWMGDRLGGLLAPSYEEIRKVDKYIEGIETLIAMAAKENICIMCMEASPNDCHRKVLIGADLFKKGIAVHHLRPRSR